MRLKRKTHPSPMEEDVELSLGLLPSSDILMLGEDQSLAHLRSSVKTLSPHWADSIFLIHPMPPPPTQGPLKMFHVRASRFI